MKVRRYEGGDLRRVLSAMITDTTVCSRIASRWEGPGLFAEPYANLVAGWCVEHVRKYGRAPGDALESIYQRWASNGRDDAMAGLVERLLVQLRRQERLPSDYALDLAARVFNRARLRRTLEAAEADLDAGREDDAYARLNSLGRVELGEGSVVKPVEDVGVWRRAFEPERARPLLGYPGRLAPFLGSAMVRGSLVAFMGPDKTGKSMLLLDLAYRAVKSRQRTAYFDMGDMTEDDVMLRLAQRVTRRPRSPGRYRWPTGFDEEGGVQYKVKHEPDGLGPGDAYKAFRRLCRGRDLLRLVCHPNSTVDVLGVESTLRDWAKRGWVADVVVIDYADIMAPPKGVSDPLEQIDVTWRYLRRLSQRLHCLVVTATQSNAAAYREGKGMLTRRHFAGRKTKLAHVNGMVGINQTAEEKDKGLLRLNWVVRREGRFSERQLVTVAGCWDVSCPIVRA